MVPTMSMPDGSTSIGHHFIDEQEVKGLLFDCDGTLLDSMPLFFHSWQTACPQYGLSMSEDEFYGFAGMPLPDIVRKLHFTQLGTEADDKMVGQFLATKKAVHKVTEAQLGCPRPIECVVVIARAAVARGVPVAVATSGLREHVEAHIEAAGLSDIFNARLGNVVCAADVAKGKPAPDIFIEAARRINVPPNQCRAYEDGESGLASAFAAGCQVIDVTSMNAYPSCKGLRSAKAAAVAQRNW